MSRIKIHLIENASAMTKKTIASLMKKKIVQSVCFGEDILVARCHVNKGNLKKELRKLRG